MKKLTYFNAVNVVAIAFLISSLPAFSAISEIDGNDVILMDAAIFGLVYKDSDNKWSFKETNHIPNKVGTRYRWAIHLKTKVDKVTWKEESTLPATPADWIEQEKRGEIRIADDKRTSIVEKTVSPKDGWISNGWAVSEGDPSGKYVMKIYLEGTFVHEFVFFVE